MPGVPLGISQAPLVGLRSLRPSPRLGPCHARGVEGLPSPVAASADISHGTSPLPGKPRRVRVLAATLVVVDD